MKYRGEFVAGDRVRQKKSSEWYEQSGETAGTVLEASLDGPGCNNLVRWDDDKGENYYNDTHLKHVNN